MSIPVPVKEEDGAPSVLEFLLRNADHSTIATCFVSESKAVGERLLAHNASDKDKNAVAHFLYHTGAVSIQVQAASQENKSQFTGFVPGDEDNRQRISAGVDVKIETKDSCPEVTAQSSTEYPTEHPGTSTRDGSGAMDDDTSDDNGYALWDQDLQSEEEATPKENITQKENVTSNENAEGVDRHDKGLECQNCHTWFRHTWDYDIHRLRCSAQRVPSVYACNQCAQTYWARKYIIKHLRNVHNVPPAEVLAMVHDLRIPKSDIASMKTQIHEVRKSSRREQMKSYACDRCDFTHSGKGPIIKHLQEEHMLSLAQTLSMYQELEVCVSKVESGKRRSKRLLKSHKRGRPRKVRRKGNVEATEERNIARSISNCSRTSPSNTSQPEECSDIDIVMDLDWRDTTQDHESANGVEGDCRKVPPEKLNLRMLSIKLQDIRKANADITVETKSQVMEAVGHTVEIALSTTTNLEMNKEMEAKQEGDEDRNQTQAGEEAVTEVSPTETSEGVSSRSSEGTEDNKLTQAGEEAVTEVSPTETSEGVSSSSSKSKKNRSMKIQNQCEICDEHFKSQHYHQRHIHHEHFGISYTCSTCNKVFDTLLGFESHVKYMHKTKADGTIFQCEICYKTFRNALSCYYHKNVHGDKYACKVCGKRHVNRREMEAHLNREHTKEKTFSCSHCDKNYYSKASLDKHNMHVHSGPGRQYECDICHQKFKYPFRVSAHKEAVHTGRSHLCEICGRSFKSKGILKQHCDTVHSTECRYKCDVCGKGFKRCSNLYAHQRTHADIRPYPCEICRKNFRTRRHLQVHTNWHNNIRDFVCEACGKAFLTKANLDKHCFTHIGRKPHPCTECEQEFVDLPSLRRHLLKKHDVHLERKLHRKSSVVKMTKPPQTQDLPSAEQEPQVKSGSSAPGMPSTPRTVMEPVHSSVFSGQPAQFDVVSSAVTASGISEDGLKTTEQVSDSLQAPAMTAQSLPHHSTNVDDNMIATEALMQIIMS
ncbi:uncharacterized protein [Diadema antillarum]|uniref:uncharacterized protein n=1 Tax=Diadema antillarum TaxID=105358 RepID=UPI003A8C517D